LPRTRRFRRVRGKPPNCQRLGQILKEQAEKGERAKVGDNAGAHRGSKRSSSGTTTLADIGISKDQSSKFQKLAEIPEDAFEEALAVADEMPSTQSVIDRAKKQSPAMPKLVDKRALWIWGTLNDFEQEVLRESPEELFRGDSAK
jgi:hypothetical protein